MCGVCMVPGQGEQHPDPLDHKGAGFQSCAVGLILRATTQKRRRIRQEMCSSHYTTVVRWQDSLAGGVDSVFGAALHKMCSTSF